MPDLATARAQANEALEQAAQTIKRRQRQDREVLQAIRQSQAVLKGVAVDTTAEGGTDDSRTEDPLT